MLTKLSAILLTLAVFSSCKKDNAENPPPPAKQFDVITTATLFNPASGDNEPVYWFNDKKHNLETGGASQAFPYGIEKKGGDIYIAGSFAKVSQADNLLYPCFWKNGKKVDLPIAGLDFTERASASDAKWFNNALYILGDADQVPVLWKINNDAVEYITKFGTAGNVQSVRKTSNMQVYDGKLYFGGNQKKLVNGNIVYTAGYWTVDENDRYVFTVLEDYLPYALCFSIAVSEKGIFLAGEAGTVLHPVPTVWTQNGQHLIKNAFNASHHRLHTVVPDSKGNLFLNVLDIQQYQPVIWKALTDGTRELVKAEVPTGAKGFCQTLDIRNDQLAYAYSYERGNQAYAAYVYNGETVTLDVYGSTLSNLNTLKLFAK